MCSSMASRIPDTKRCDYIEQLHGNSISDPYIWLEQLDESATKDWILEQNELCEEVLESIPGRESIRTELESLVRRERYRIPTKRGNQYFFLYNDGTMEHDALYCSREGLENSKKLFDPYSLSMDGSITIRTFVVSQSGSKIAIAVSKRGFSWQEIQVLDVISGKLFPEKLIWCHSTDISWNRDESGFYYSRYPEPGENFKAGSKLLDHMLCFHRVGSNQSEDEIIFRNTKRRDMLVRGQVTEDFKYLFIRGYTASDSNAVYLMRLDDSEAQVDELYTDGIAEFSYVGNSESALILLTNHNAPNKKLVRIRMMDSNRYSKEIIIPESEDVLCWALRTGDKLLVRHLRISKTILTVHSLNGRKLSSIKLPCIGSVLYATGSPREDEALFEFTSYTVPWRIYSLNVNDMMMKEVSSYQYNTHMDEYHTEQVFLTSSDDTSIPMFLTYRRDTQKNGKNPVLLRCYGGFGIASTPRFNEGYYQWLKMGGILAIPGVRGGGEYGTTWHEAGKQKNKKNTIADYIAAAEWMIQNKFTNTDLLVGSGGSHGGFLVAACMIHRPDLFRVCILESGVYDMLRFCKYTFGWIKKSEYGSPEIPDQFEVLYSISPYHNVKENVQYPAVLVITGENDPNVYPAHSYKFVAELQHACSKAPFGTILKVLKDTGHANRVSIGLKIDVWTDELSFAAYHVGMPIAYSAV